ncbi:MAG: acyltransferase [Lachnospiraceae bacterium]|nr:acyltransferase [Lachnospiraceae bacterium]
MAEEGTKGKERIVWLDIVRAFAVVLIILTHFNDTLKMMSITIAGKHYLVPSVFANGSFGTLGVSLFFLISGAALMYTYDKELKLSTYYWKRWKGIYPAFWICYAGAFLYYFWKRKGIAFQAEKWTFFLTVLGFDGYTAYRIENYYILGEWFLGCIVLMYLMFPLIRKLYHKNAYLTFVAYTLFYVVFVWFYPFEMSIVRNLFTRLLDFLFGMLIIYKGKRENSWVLVLNLLLFVILLFYEVPLHGMYGISLIGISCFMVLVGMSKWIKSPLFIQLCQKLGKYSYTIFLVHHVIITDVLRRFMGVELTMPEGIVLFGMVSIMIVLVSWCAFRVEKKTVGMLENLLSISKKISEQI